MIFTTTNRTDLRSWPLISRIFWTVCRKGAM